jgi:catechol 2,3-dioxygenase-like lactoylglutathione lyase family enzyme
MAIRNIDHVNIRTRSVAETVRFYVDCLGMKATPTPVSEDMNESAWLCDEGVRAAIHVGSAAIRYAADETAPAETAEGSGKLHHVAFECSDYAAMVARLEARKQRFDVGGIPEIKLRQLFVRDPNGILIELNFLGD